MVIYSKVCENTPLILFLSSSGIICVSSIYGIQYVQFIEIIEGYINVNWILIMVTQN